MLNKTCTAKSYEIDNLMEILDVDSDAQDNVR